MEAVILAAGRGRRLGREGDGIPKCLARVGERTIIEHQLNALRSVGVGRIVVVVGYRKAALIRFILERYSDIHFVENTRFAWSNTIYSLYLAVPALRDDFFFLNGDVLLERGLLVRLMGGTGMALAVEYKHCSEEEVKVKLVGRRIVAISKEMSREEAAGEFVGVALFRRAVHEVFFESLRHEVEICGVTYDYFERALDRIANRVEILSVDVTGEPVIEIDFPEDLEKARMLAKRMEHGSFPWHSG